MRNEEFATTVEKIVTNDPRFSPEAYAFIGDAVLYTTRIFREENGPKRHITGQELLEGIRSFALAEFGPMAKNVLNSWGITDSMSIGHIVFNMVDNNLLGSSENDSIEDFRDGFDFDEAFCHPFLPSASSADSEPSPAIDL